MTWMDDKELYRQFEVDDARAKAMQAALAEAEMGQMMQREPSPHLASKPGTTPPEPVAEIERLRAALREIATVDENGLAEYTPQAMVAQARAALGDAS